MDPPSLPDLEPKESWLMKSSDNTQELPSGKIHSKRVEKMENYTRNEWRRLKTTLETSGEDVKLHSKRVEK